MAHEIPALSDDNTFVGYNHITKEYYVRNLDTKTAAKSASDAKLILDITAPNNDVSEERIEQLSHTLEDITDIYYTLEDSGRYIKTICFNDYKALAMQYDEPSLYIRGSNEMWNMASTISAESVSLFMWQYYVYYVGLNMPRKLMNAIIDYYVSIQKPYVYNTILPLTEEEKDNGAKLKYSNEFIMNNVDKSSRGEYSGVKNPEGVYTLNVYDVKSSVTDTVDKTFAVNTIEKSKNKINLANLLPADTFEEGMVIRIQGTDNAELDNDYTVDRQENDTVDPLDPDKAKTHVFIVEEESFPANFVVLNNPDILKIVEPGGVPAQETITDNLITCTENPVCDIGDIIQITDTSNKLFGNLTVKQVINKNIYVNENIQSQALTEADEARVWINAYKIDHMGYDEYTEIKSSQQVASVNGKNVYLLDVLLENQYAAGETVYINYGDGVVSQHTIDSGGVHLSTFSGNGYTQGYLVVTPAPATTGLPYLLGKEPVFIEKRNTVSYPENSITLSGSPTLAKDDTFDMFNTDINGTYKVDSIEGNKIYVVRENEDEDLPKVNYNGNSNPGIVQIRKYSERILLDMKFSRRADKMPMGKFMLDNNQQFTQYLELYRIVPPTSQNYADLNQEVTMKYYLGENLNGEGDVYMECLGLYSDNYEDL